MFLFIFLQIYNQGISQYGRPYDSTQGFSPEGKQIFFLIILIFFLYIGFRVLISLKNKK